MVAAAKTSASSGSLGYLKRPRVSITNERSCSENSEEDSLDETSSKSMMNVKSMALHSIKTHSKLHKLVDQIFADLERLKSE